MSLVLMLGAREELSVVLLPQSAAAAVGRGALHGADESELAALRT